MAELLSVQPGELRFPYESSQQSSCVVKVMNNTMLPVAFKVKTTSPKKYCVRPNSGFIPPQNAVEVTVTMQAQREPPTEQCKDKFLLQGAVLPKGSTSLSSEMFTKESGNEVSEKRLKVVYVAREELPKEEKKSVVMVDLRAKIHEVNATLASLAEERRAAVLLSERLQQELSKKAPAPVKEEVKPQLGFPFLVVFLVGLLGVLLGHMLTA